MADQKPPGIEAATELLAELDERTERLKIEFLPAAKAADEQRRLIDGMWNRRWAQKGRPQAPPKILKKA
jgi:hypothetical protein